MKNNIKNEERKTCLGRLMKNEKAEQKGKGGRREKERKEMSLVREGVVVLELFVRESTVGFFWKQKACQVSTIKILCQISVFSFPPSLSTKKVCRW